MSKERVLLGVLELIGLLDQSAEVSENSAPTMLELRDYWDDFGGAHITLKPMCEQPWKSEGKRRMRKLK